MHIVAPIRQSLFGELTGRVPIENARGSPANPTELCPLLHIQRDKNKELEAKNKELERRLAEEKRLRQKADAKYESLLQLGFGAHQEIEPAPSADGSTSKDHCRAAQPVHDNASEERQNSCRSAGLEEVQSTSSDAIKDNQRQHQHPMQTGQSQPPITLSRQNSFDARSQAVAVPQSTTGPSSATKQFDPLGAAIPISQSSSNAAQTGVTNAKTQTNPFDPLGTPGDIDPVRVLNGVSQVTPGALNIVPLIPDTASDTPHQPSADHAKYATNHANARTNHFDPLGTPERLGSCPKANDAFPAIMLNGLPQIPDISTHSPTREKEDPFDEIVRMSHSQLQDYD